MKTIKPDQLDDHTPLIDVREFDEYAEKHLENSTCIPLKQVLNAAQRWDPEKPVTLICKLGGRAAQAGQQLEQIGFKNVTVVETGVDNHKDFSRKLIVNKNRIPIQRQVMIGAGLFLLIGLLLTAFVNAKLIALVYFVACALIFAGLTGFCPMAIILQKMPWNQIPADDATSCCAAPSAGQGI